MEFGEISDSELEHHDARETDGSPPVHAENLNAEVKAEPSDAMKERKKQGRHKSGVCYLSRIPPRMKPLKLRQLLSPFAEIGRVYLAPEDEAVVSRRKQDGGKGGKNFSEGWVEFVRKRDAKAVAAMLNGQPIGGRHRSMYRFDLWNIKYLKRFKWDHLTEEIAYRSAVREQKISAELRAAAKERDAYVARVHQAKALAAMEERRKRRQQQAEAKEGSQGGVAPAGSAAAAQEGVSEGRRPRRAFSQRSVVDAEAQQPGAASHDFLRQVLG